MTAPCTPVQKKCENRLQSIAIPPSPFLESLGFGTGVNVWKLQDSKFNKTMGSPWAIKNIRTNMTKNLSNKYEKLLKKEAKMLKTLFHENIIGFRGYGTAEDGRKCLAMEFGGESLGSMIEYRFENDMGPFAPELILKVALNVAKALKYLHEEKNILHGDIKSYNIVIKNDFEIIKLCDFGVSIELDVNGIANEFVGTPVYSAPECQENSKVPITCKADIFSLGLVLWEMIALTPPHCDFSGIESDCSYLSSSSDLEDQMDGSCLSYDCEKFGTRPNLPDVKLGPEYTKVIEIFYCCTEHDQRKRPNANRLIEYICSGKENKLQS